MNSPKKFHLLVIGGGSAGFSATHRALELGAKVTMFNSGLPLGGTCPNVGCVPSKTMIRGAEALHRATSHGFRGLRIDGGLESFAELAAQRRQLVEDLVRVNYLEVVPTLQDLEVIFAPASIVHPTAVLANGRIHEGHAILVATGSSPSRPAFPGLDTVPYVTSREVFEMNDLPESMIVLGGGYIALECAQTLARLGTRVTIVQRSPNLLKTLDPVIGNEIGRHLAGEGIHILCGTAVTRISGDDHRITVEGVQNGKPFTRIAEKLLVAAGRTPNTTGLGLDDVGVKLNARAGIDTNDFLCTSVPGIFAAGDVLGGHLLVYTASYEGELAAANALAVWQGSQAPAPVDYRGLPWVIFTDPQVSGVGMDEAEAKAIGLDVDSAILPATRWPRFRTTFETRGFLKMIRNRKNDLLVGARAVVPESGELMNELGLVMRHNITITALKESFHPYLTLLEGIQRCALKFPPPD